MKTYKVVIDVFEETVFERQKEYTTDIEAAIREAFIWLEEDGIYLQGVEEIKE
jgi:hypothetical protein